MTGLGVAFAALIASGSSALAAPAGTPAQAGTPSQAGSHSQAGSQSPANAGGGASCTVSEDGATQPFVRFHDRHTYIPVPGGVFTSAIAPATLTGGAALVSDTDPLGDGTATATSLSLPAGSSVTTAPVCVDSRFPTLRLMARRAGDVRARLGIEVLHLDASGRHAAKSHALLVPAHVKGWFLVHPRSVRAGGFGRGGNSPQRIAIRIVAPANGPTWEVNDIYVDPHSRG